MLYFVGFRQTQPGLPNHRMSTRIRSPHVILKSPQLRFKLEKKTALGRGSRSDRPCYHAHTRWTLQAATGHGRVMLHTRPDRASSQLTTSHWKLTTTAVNKFSRRTRYSCSTLISALTFDLDLRPSPSIPQRAVVMTHAQAKSRLSVSWFKR